ncbi:MAG: TIR domain-containing protein [Chloroflexi bacterium]|uniref:TIR domain-containing protein n=1 Tax=Candidatus Flexifilum breve TaxID=3140694 RepID=UPI003134C4AA|nr:TIR domain-containing protein [Chloroflexota bacterium]
MGLVFVSYSRKDAEFVLRLTTELKQHAVPIWLDQFDITLGQRWDVAIENALRQCTHVLAVLSPNAVSSHNVLDEISYAIEEKKVLIPVELADCEIPFRLRRFQRKRFQDSYNRAFVHLLAELPRHGKQTGGLDDTVIQPAGEQHHQPLVIDRQITVVTPGSAAGTVPVLVFQDDSRRTRVAISRTPLIIGRGPDCDIIIVRNSQVSRSHIRISTMEGAYFVEDLGSRNGTAVNGSNVRPGYRHSLKPGYRIDIPGVTIQFELGAAPVPPPRKIDDTDGEGTNGGRGWTVPVVHDPVVKVFAATHTVTINGVDLKPPLTVAQFRFLQLLYNEYGSLCTRDEIAEFVWPETEKEWVNDQVLDSVAQAVRDRIAEHDQGWEYILREGDHSYRLNNRPMKK